MKRKPIRFLYWSILITYLIAIILEIIIFKMIIHAYISNSPLDVIIGLAVFLVPILWIILTLKLGRIFLSTITITKDGVRASYLKVYFDARWDELTDIGVALGPAGVGVYYIYIYFSKVQQNYCTPQQFAGIRPSQDFVKIELTQKVLDEVLKYVPLERIRGTNRSVLNRFKLPNQNR